ncbi:zinc finger CCCH domain-containing protein [Acrasis kona]|uniref:Zinc finger CCCH domain-containing protein n=1 Tax=Acrasis kona TaxID=1008807 RepID=A0AAW2YR15_9EUKA
MNTKSLDFLFSIPPRIKGVKPIIPEESNEIQVVQNEQVEEKDDPQSSSGNDHTKYSKSRGGSHSGAKAKFEPTKMPCKFYQEGRCSKGSACTFSHEIEQKRSLDLCKFFLIGACTKGDSCVYSHDTTTFPCKHFHIHNSCRSGDACRFSHQPMTPRQQELLQNQQKQNEKTNEKSSGEQQMDHLFELLEGPKETDATIELGSVFTVN